MNVSTFEGRNCSSVLITSIHSLTDFFLPNLALCHNYTFQVIKQVLLSAKITQRNKNNIFYNYVFICKGPKSYPKLHPSTCDNWQRISHMAVEKYCCYDSDHWTAAEHRCSLSLKIVCQRASFKVLSITASNSGPEAGEQPQTITMTLPSFTVRTI